MDRLYQTSQGDFTVLKNSPFAAVSRGVSVIGMFAVVRVIFATVDLPLVVSSLVLNLLSVTVRKCPLPV